jgi:CDP-diacylglycerol--glycerol-3-phosphate 3-phosphatidyltransferase
MFTLVSRDVFWVLPVVIIAAREIAVSLYRVFAGSKGVSMPASKLAKIKTVMQQCAVGFALMPLSINDATWTYVVCLWVAVALTLVSAAQYAQRAVVSAR